MRPLLSSRWLPALGILLALVLLALAVDFTRNSLRVQLRDQLARREASLVSGLLNEKLRLSRGGPFGDDLVALLETAVLPELPGVQSLNLYDTNGTFNAPLSLLGGDSDLSSRQIEEVRKGAPVSRYGTAEELDSDAAPDLSGTGLAGRKPMLEVIVPIRSADGVPEAYAKFLLDASGLKAEYESLDATLRRQSRLAFLLAGGAMTVALAFVFHQLAETQRRLIRVNRELTLAAKTAAVGAVTSHLIHGLKNPLAGLRQFVSTGAKGPSRESGVEWSEAADSTRRMQAMIDAVTGVLREDSGLIRYEISPQELLDHLVQREASFSRENSVRLESSVKAGRPIPNRDANVSLLILENLVRNAVQASPSGGVVRIRATETPETVEFRVRDDGGGLPESVRERLFTPVVTEKEGGTGLGLALSQQLARSLGATLELEETGPRGTEFVLRLGLREGRTPGSTEAGPG
ncbi:MAG: HAMP domain-containing histidine kinase [Verrucomicrobiales bacterium]|nr:HAMP domain-containing histidine kinase [Verrucomicrobiales bacterium]